MAVALAWCVGAPWQLAPAAAAAAAVDLTVFELEFLAGWLQGFQVCDRQSAGQGKREDRARARCGSLWLIRVIREERH